MKNTYEEAVLKCVLWWVEKSFHTSLNQNNGDDSTNGGISFMLMNMLSMQAQDSVTPNKIKKFEEKLTELLMAVKDSSNKWDKELDVDYHLCQKLTEAAKYADIDFSCFPIKSWTVIDNDNKVFAKYQYGAEPIEL